MAGGIYKKSNAEILDSSYEDDAPIRLCPDCLKPLLERVYPPDQITKNPAPIPRDHDSWLQCHRCFRVFAKYEVKTEDKLESFVATDTNPHDVGASVVSLDNKKPKPKRDRDMERFQKELDAVEDPDEKRDRKRIGIVKIINDTMSNY